MTLPANFKLGFYPVNSFVKFIRLLLSWLAWFLRQCWAVVVVAGLGMVSYLIITHFVFQSVQVDGQSMLPTLENSGSYWLNRFAYVKSEPHSCDIVTLKDPRD